MRTLIVLLCIPCAFAAFPNGYSYCKVVTTSHTMVSGASALTNYPLTVILTDPTLKTTGNGGLVNNANGYDIGFYPDCSGIGTALKWEMDAYNSSTGAIVVHVLRPTLSNAVNDTIGMYYGGSFSTFQSTATAVWDTTYKGVWHIPNGTTLTSPSPDSTGSNNGTVSGAPAVATGKLDGAATFGLNRYLDMGSPTMPASPMTVSAWINPASVGQGSNQTIVSKGYNGSTTQWQLMEPASSLVVNFNTYNGGTTKSVSSSGTLINGTWAYIAAVYDGTTFRMYFNGAPDGTSVAGGPVANNAKLEVGAVDVNGSAGQFFGGVIDEVRISNIARSADWILTEYRNQSAPVTYISEGSQQTYSGNARVLHSVREGE